MTGTHEFPPLIPPRIQRLRTGHHIPDDAQVADNVGLDAPANHGDLSVANLDAGDAVGRDDRASVEVGRLVQRGEARAMRMPGNDHVMGFPAPVDQLLVDPLGDGEVLGGAGGVSQTIELQVAPECAHDKAPQRPHQVRHQIALMTVHQQDLALCGSMLQNQPLVNDNVREKWFARLGDFVEEGIKVGLDETRVLLFDVVVAHQHIKAFLSVEAHQQFEDDPVGSENLGKVVMLPQVVAITHFDIGIALMKIVRERVINQVLVFSKIIRPAIISPVTITEEDQPRIIVDGDALSDLPNFVQARKSAHGVLEDVCVGISPAWY